MSLYPPPLLGLVFFIALVIAYLAPEAVGGVLTPIERFGDRLARRKRLSIGLIAAVVALIRIGLLRAIPVPVPEVTDEFSYLLAADTFAHGRLTNPPHPMWVYFDTFHVNQHPTYMSKYPPAQGAVLALGQLLGHPWIGVVLSVAVMCGAILWALQGWLPPQWALLGGVLALLHLGIFSYWMNSYWGGAVAAIGGALVVGSLPRILHFRRPRDAALLGLGVAILANSRAFEGFIFCLPVFAVLIVWLCGRRSPPWRETTPRLIAPVFGVLALTALFMGYYNWRGTGHPLLFPYTVNNRTYITSPEFVWQQDKPPLHYLNPQFEAFYNVSTRDIANYGRANNLRNARRLLKYDAHVYFRFFLWLELCVPLLAVPWVLNDRRVRFLVFQFTFCFLAFLLVVWFSPHYAAPLTATAFALVTQGTRHLRRCRIGSRRVGVGLCRGIVILAVLFAPFYRSDVNDLPAMKNRARLAAQLDSMPGDHLVIVKYSDHHFVHTEWVYNRADIDHSKTVWAREIPGISLEPLLNYFRRRDVWLVEPDTANPQLSRYKFQPDDENHDHH